MTTIVDAHWVAKEGEADTVASLTEQLVAAARQEPGCLAFRAARSTEDPRRFFLFEEFTDRAAYDAHVAAPHFQDIVKLQIDPRLESQDFALYEPLEP
jgi:quinol monooxygenase YgiN